MSPSSELQAPKEMKVSQDPRGSPDLLDSQARVDHRVYVTAVEAATEPLSKQVSYEKRSDILSDRSDTQPGDITI